MLSGLDLLIALLSIPGFTNRDGEEIRGITRLVKLVFLLLKQGDFESKIDTEYDYKAYDYGPYSSRVIKELDMLETANLVKIRKVPLPSIKEIIDREAALHDLGDDYDEEKYLEVYSITERGLDVWEGVVKKKLSNDDIDQIRDIKTRFNGMELEKLLRYVYEEYPDYIVESKIIQDIFGYGSRPSLTPFEREE